MKTLLQPFTLHPSLLYLFTSNTSCYIKVLYFISCINKKLINNLIIILLYKLYEH